MKQTVVKDFDEIKQDIYLYDQVQLLQIPYELYPPNWKYPTLLPILELIQSKLLAQAPFVFVFWHIRTIRITNNLNNQISLMSLLKIIRILKVLKIGYLLLYRNVFVESN